MRYLSACAGEEREFPIAQPDAMREQCPFPQKAHLMEMPDS